MLKISITTIAQKILLPLVEKYLPNEHAFKNSILMNRKEIKYA